MAEKVPTVSDVLEIVEEKLNCSICLQSFTQPKSLPCLHAFCKVCLGHLPRLPQGDGQVVRCPICRRPAQLPKDGVSGFPDQFTFNDYADVQQILKKIAGNQQGTCEACNEDQAQGFCRHCERFLCQKCINAHHKMKGFFPGHEILSINEVIVAASQLKPIKKASTLECPKHKKPLAVYCHSPCDQLICHDCTIRIHKDHECDPISEDSVFKRYKQEINDSLLPAKQRLAFILCKIEAFKRLAAEIAENRDRVKEEIRATGEQMIAEYPAAVRQSVGQLEKKADTGAEQKLTFMSAQIKDAQTTAAVFQSCVDYVEEELRMGSQQQILASKTQIVDRMKLDTSQFTEEEYSLTEESEIKILKSTGQNTDVGEVEFSRLVDRFKVSGEGISKAIIGRKTNFTLAITPTPGSAPLSLPTSLITCQLFAPEAVCPTDCIVIETSPGKYEVSYTPVTNGPHKLRLRVGDVDIPGSPFTVQDKMKGTPLRTIGGLSRPWGVAVGRDGSVVVTEYNGHCVTVLDKEGKKIKSFGSCGTNIEQFQYPSGVVITCDNKIIVSDKRNHRIQKFDMEGRFVAAVGSQGNGQLQFQSPFGINANVKDKILLVEYRNHRIHVVNSDLSFSHTFGVRGSQPGQFQYPYCIAIDSKGMVYVTNNNNHRVQKFTPEGVFVAQFGKEGTGEGELMDPCGIAIDTITDTVYVSSSHKVSMFATNGKFLREFGRKGSGEGEFKWPVGLAVDENTGDLYVCDFVNDRLVVY